MNKNIIRSLLAKALVVLISMSGLVGWAHAQVELKLSSLADNLYLLEGAGANILVNNGADGLVLVDGGNVVNAKAVLGTLQKEFGDAPVAALFNTHWHLDHTGLNALFSNSIDVISHENTKLWMTTEIISKWNDKIYLPQKSSTLPNKTSYFGSNKLSINDAEIEYGYLPQGHTDGDIYVSFPKQNVIAAGGVIASGGYPVLDYSTGGWLGGMIDSLQMLLELGDENTRFISSMGEVRSRADLEAQLEMCQVAIRAITQSYYAGDTFAQFVASKPMQAYDQRWGNSTLFLETAYEGAWGHVTELRRYR